MEQSPVKRSSIHERSGCLMNLDLLRRVRQHILDHPKRFCAAEWAWARNVDDVVRRGGAPHQFRCCIAGHVLVLGGRFDEAELLRHSVRRDDGYLARAAGDLLALTATQRTMLFYPSQWPEPFRSAYYRSPDAFAEARIAADVLAHFVSKHAGSSTAPDRLPVPHAAASVPDDFAEHGV